jgi:hypothetical protein
MGPRLGEWSAASARSSRALRLVRRLRTILRARCVDMSLMVMVLWLEACVCCNRELVVLQPLRSLTRSLLVCRSVVLSESFVSNSKPRRALRVETGMKDQYGPGSACMRDQCVHVRIRTFQFLLRRRIPKFVVSRRVAVGVSISRVKPVSRPHGLPTCQANPELGVKWAIWIPAETGYLIPGALGE